ncbi:M48 family metalloprotease [Micromonospora sp. NBC_01813]|uniref:M48 family metalloprotease n=1 Tax=Micromonospora sp. NBC_01813 TaxID=2975988 RepID=UPI002DD7ECD6|nr:M48 family metalloprotease [Micromonospora sp. NBC_01813]WSA10820.1 M48 family metalloprotease [Micromonospora sp. NBC_01813]
MALTGIAPLVLRPGTWQVRRPKAALAAWFTVFLLGAGFAVAAVANAVRVVFSPGAVLGDGFAAHLFAWVVLGTAATGAVFVGLSAQALAAGHQDAVAASAPDVVHREQRRGLALIEFRAVTPIAYAASGRDRRILYSSGLREMLTAAQLQAVLAHEYTHLRYRHDLVVRVAELNALLLPGSWAAGAAMRRATSLLVELIADDTAAKQAGAANLAAALLRIGEPGMELRAGRLNLRRWPQFSPHRVPSAVRI